MAMLIKLATLTWLVNFVHGKGRTQFILEEYAEID